VPWGQIENFKENDTNRRSNIWILKRLSFLPEYVLSVYTSRVEWKYSATSATTIYAPVKSIPVYKG